MNEHIFRSIPTALKCFSNTVKRGAAGTFEDISKYLDGIVIELVVQSECMANIEKIKEEERKKITTELKRDNTRLRNSLEPKKMIGYNRSNPIDVDQTMDIKSLLKYNDSLNTQIGQLNSEITLFKKSLGSYKKESDRFNHCINTLKEEVLGLKKEKTSLESRLKTANNNMISYKTQLQISKDEMNKMAKENGNILSNILEREINHNKEQRELLRQEMTTQLEIEKRTNAKLMEYIRSMRQVETVPQTPDPINEDVYELIHEPDTRITDPEPEPESNTETEPISQPVTRMIDTYNAEERVFCEYEGYWRNAKILEVGCDMYKIHFHRALKSEDVWVHASRLYKYTEKNVEIKRFNDKLKKTARVSKRKHTKEENDRFVKRMKNQ
jgi:hypothetical protein